MQHSNTSPNSWVCEWSGWTDAWPFCTTDYSYHGLFIFCHHAIKLLSWVHV